MPVPPDKIATWANAITVSRILLTPVMFALIPDHERGSWLAFGMWFVLCISDLIDGRLARKHGTTSSGAFLDPLADKVLVLSAMWALVRNDMFWWLPVVLIAGRELAISVYRIFVGAKGVSVPATQLGKWKTFVQQLAVGFALWPWFSVDVKWLWVSLLWIAVALSLTSGAHYFWYASRRPRAVPASTPRAA